MKHLYKLLLLGFICFLSQTSKAFIDPAAVTSTSEKKFTTEPVAKPSPFGGMRVKDYLAITPAKYKEITGKKMTLLQKFSLKVIQAKMKKQIKKGRITESTWVDFQDPVNKWMWFWIFGWGIGLVLLFVPVLWILSSLFFLFGTISLIIWIVKKSS